MEAVFRVEGNRVFTTEHAGGPWDPGMQHGGAPSSLIVWAAERIPTPQPMHIARLTVDLMRPVPVTALYMRIGMVTRESLNCPFQVARGAGMNGSERKVGDAWSNQA